MADKDASFTEKATEEMQEKSPAEAVGDDLSDSKTQDASEATAAESEEFERERQSDQSPDEAADRHWKADS